MEKKLCKHCRRPNATIEKISAHQFYVVCPDCGTCTDPQPNHTLALQAWHNGIVTHVSELAVTISGVRPLKPVVACKR